MVGLKNQGSGPLPSSTSQPGGGPALALKKDNRAFSSWVLYGSSLGGLKNAGGTLNWTKGGDKIIGTVSIRATIDSGNRITESNETNNSLTKTLTCNPPLPDLAITDITFTQDCRAQVHLKNVGKSPLRALAHTVYGPIILRTIDGRNRGWVRLSNIDPGKKLQAPGGIKIWVDNAEFKAKTQAKYQIRKTAQEQSSANNTKVAKVLRRCISGRFILRKGRMIRKQTSPNLLRR